MKYSETRMTINEVKIALRATHKGYKPRLIVKDISSTGSYGDKFAIFRATWNNDYAGYWDWDETQPIALSDFTHFPNAKNKKGGIGAYSETFDVSEINTALSNHS